MITISALYVLGCDLVVGTLLVRYWFAARSHGRNIKIPMSWWLVISLINVSALFAGPRIQEAVAILGGVCLILLLLAAITREQKKEPNQSLQRNAGTAPSADEALPPRG